MVRKDIEGAEEMKLEKRISHILIAGVAISLTLEAAGMILFYRLYHSTAISQDPALFLHGQDFFTFLGRLVSSRPSVSTPLYLMILGVAVLILTPYIRAIMSAWYFASIRNVKYLVITIFVLVILTVSLATH